MTDRIFCMPVCHPSSLKFDFSVPYALAGGGCCGCASAWDCPSQCLKSNSTSNQHPATAAALQPMHIEACQGPMHAAGKAAAAAALAQVPAATPVPAALMS
eukprot:scaffold259595_cov17-Tisochrysis_lutea.AAC.1